jgi:hypothetical protein
MDLQEHRLDTDSVIIAAVPASMIPLVWDRVVPQLEKPIALSHGEVTLDSIKARIMSGDVLLITVSRGIEIIAVNTVEVRESESGLRALYIPLIGGSEMEEWMDRFLKIVKAIAKDFNCTELRGIAARKGWMRKLKPLGWSEVSTIIKCDVGD